MLKGAKAHTHARTHTEKNANCTKSKPVISRNYIGKDACGGKKIDEIVSKKEWSLFCAFTMRPPPSCWTMQ